MRRACIMIAPLVVATACSSGLGDVDPDAVGTSTPTASPTSSIPPVITATPPPEPTATPPPEPTATPPPEPTATPPPEPAATPPPEPAEPTLEQGAVCDVVDPARVLTIAPGLEDFTVNTVASTVAGTCTFDASRATNYYLTVATGVSPTDLLRSQMSIDDLSDLRTIDEGVTLRSDEDSVEAVAVRSGDRVALFRQAGSDLIPVEAWEGPLASYLVERLTVVYGP